MNSRTLCLVALGLIALGTASAAENPVVVITMEQMQELTGYPWKCNDPALNWITESINRIRKIQVGSTRAQLLQLFQPSGQTGDRFRHRFDFRESRDNALLQLDVEFARDPTRLPANEEQDLDLITRISAIFVTTARRTPQQQSDMTWVDETLQRIRTIKPGMTRKQLHEVFRSQGGLSTPLQETLVSRDCPMFQADFEFEAVGRPARDGDGRVAFPGSEQDLILRMSAPYVASEVSD